MTRRKRRQPVSRPRRLASFPPKHHELTAEVFLKISTFIADDERCPPGATITMRVLSHILHLDEETAEQAIGELLNTGQLIASEAGTPMKPARTS